MHYVRGFTIINIKYTKLTGRDIIKYSLMQLNTADDDVSVYDVKPVVCRNTAWPVFTYPESRKE